MSILGVETKMTDEQRSLLLTILVNPGDHTPILVYCDWMQENEQEETAHKVRNKLWLGSRGYLDFDGWYEIKGLLGLEKDISIEEFDVYEDDIVDVRGTWATYCVEPCDKDKEEIENWLKMYLKRKEIQRARED